MNLRRMSPATIGMALLLLLPPAYAHHSEAGFDQSRQIVVDGTVRTFDFGNPHSSLTVVERKPDGQEVVWRLETGGPSALLRFGVTKTSFAAGDRVVVTAHPHRTEAALAGIVRVVKADGTTFMLENAK
jgi:hypothetical protein